MASIPTVARCCWTTATLLLWAGASAAAQEPGAEVTEQAVVRTPGWRISRLGTVEVGGQMSLGVGAGIGLSRPGRPGPFATSVRLALLGRYGITGSRDLSLVLTAPAELDGWRFFAVLRTERMLRVPYFGPDNQAASDDSLSDRYGTIYNRYALLRHTAFGAVQRRIVGPLWLHAGGQARGYRASPLSQQPTRYGEDVTAGRLADTASASGTEGRAGLLWDTRDFVAAPQRGVLLEVIGAAGRLRQTTAGVRASYTRVLLGAREFIPLGDSARTVLALRQRVTLASDTLPYVLALEQVTSELPDDGTSARLTRLHGRANQLASNQALLSVDIRHKLLMVRQDPERPIRLWALLAADVAVLWEPRQATARRTEWTAAAGWRMQTAKASLFGADAGWTERGPALKVTFAFAW